MGRKEVVPGVKAGGNRSRRGRDPASLSRLLTAPPPQVGVAVIRWPSQGLCTPLCSGDSETSAGPTKKQPGLSPFQAFQRKPDITPTNDGGHPTCHRSTSASLGPHL